MHGSEERMHGSEERMHGSEERMHRSTTLGRRASIAVTVAVGAVARAGYLLVVADEPLRSDASQYHGVAANIANGLGYSDIYPQLEMHATAFRPPLFPGLLGAVYSVFWPSPGIGRLVSVALGLAAIAALTWLLHRRLGPAPALAGGLALALLPNAVANDVGVLTEPLSLLIIVGLLAALLDRRWIWVGVATGLLVLARPSAQFLVIPVAIWLVVVLDWRRAAAAAGVAALVVTPWVVRNWVQLGSPVLVTSNGYNYAARYSPPAMEKGGFVDPMEDPYFDQDRLVQFDEVAWDRRLRTVALDALSDDPTFVAEVVAKNTLSYFELNPSTNTPAEYLDGRSLTIRRWTLPLFYGTLIAGVAGLWSRWRDPLAIAAALVGVYFTAASLFFVAPPRLRAPFELALCIGIGLLAAELAARRAPAVDSADA